MAESVVEFLLNHLTIFIQQESSLLGGIREEAESIRDELVSMRAFLRVADEKQDIDPQLQAWVEKVRDVAHDTEDVLDEFMLRFARYHHGDGFYGFLGKISFSIKNLKARHRIGSEIRKIKSRVENIHQRYRDGFSISEHGSSSTVDNTWYDRRGDALLLEEAELDGPKKHLIGWLLDDSPRLRVVSVVGMGGMGKTTLVKKAYDDMGVKNRFQCHAWITVSQSFHLRELLKDVVRRLFDEAKQQAPQSLETMDINDLKAKIKDFLQQRRYVLVLDDVWSINAWDALKYAFPDNNSGSRILLTTRIVGVASTSCCEGLPLAVVAISGVLATKDKSRVHDWELFYRRLGDAQLEVHDKLESMKNILSLSYYDLPYYLKICFLYLGLFPEDYEIERMRVIRLWIAEGFVKEIGGMTMEEVADVAEGYLKAPASSSSLGVPLQIFLYKWL
ncbi:disease resistance protein RPM1-like [Cornus florida]|uniref:disease resistance protein RPM1-like n=1 Tax=Cornus florida TaxID=4283 RepID=UPI00289D3270|nr:disease resistance protein RPM1-like [Cornus florida]